MTTDARDQFDRTAAGYSVSRAHSASESLRLFKEFAGDRRYGVALDMASVSAPFHILVPHPRHLVFTGRRINKQQNTRRTQNTPRLSKKRGNRSKVVRDSATHYKIDPPVTKRKRVRIDKRPANVLEPALASKLFHLPQHPTRNIACTHVVALVRNCKGRKTRTPSQCRALPRTDDHRQTP